MCAYSYYPFDAGAGATVSQAQWENMTTRWIADGVARGVQNALAVAAPGGMNVSVDTGTAFLLGTYFNNSALVTLAISAADPSLPRLDAVVVHADLAAHTVDARVLTGTPAASPVAPAVTQSASVWEILLATVAVAATATQVTSGNLTDQRAYAGAQELRAGAKVYPNASDLRDVLGYGLHGTSTDISLESIARAVTIGSGSSIWQKLNNYYDGTTDRFMTASSVAAQVQLVSNGLHQRFSTNTPVANAAITWGPWGSMWTDANAGDIVVAPSDPGVGNYGEGSIWIQA